VVDDEGEEIFADKMGVILARDLAPAHPGAPSSADVKSTGLFAADPVLRERLAPGRLLEDRAQPHEAAGARSSARWRGSRSRATTSSPRPSGAATTAGCASAVEICRLLDRHPGQSLSDLRRALPRTFTSPPCRPSARIREIRRDRICGGRRHAGRAMRSPASSR
jgi:phosphomannomutase / phosphoglucomutase